MNVNQIINMVIRMFMRKAINKGIDAGAGMVARRRGTDENDPEAARAQDASARNTAKQAKRAMRLGRRMTRL